MVILLCVSFSLTGIIFILVETPNTWHFHQMGWSYTFNNSIAMVLWSITLSWRRSLSYRNQFRLVFYTIGTSFIKELTGCLSLCLSFCNISHIIILRRWIRMGIGFCHVKKVSWEAKKSMLWKLLNIFCKSFYRYPLNCLIC